MSERRVIVVGAGVGGLCAAIGARRAGFDVAVFDKATDMRQIQVGTGLHLWPNATKALRQLGLEQAVIDVGMIVQRVEFRRWTGRLMGVLPVGEIARRIGGPAVGVRRTHLHRVLAEAFGLDSIRLGAAFTQFTQDGDGVTAQFADGSDEQADLLVGADGLNSAVRTQLLGSSPPKYHGYTSWLGLADFEHEKTPPELLTVVWGRGGRFIFYHLEPGRIGWIGNVDAPEGQRIPTGERKARALADFQGWMEPVEAIIAATEEEWILRMDLYDRDPVPRWGEGRVTLLGDAAHVMTPNIAQGACQAIEDAVVLMKELSVTSDGVADALRAYEAKRMLRTAPLVKRARLFGTVGQWRNPIVCAIRDGFIRMSEPVMAKQEEKLYAHEV